MKEDLIKIGFIELEGINPNWWGYKGKGFSIEIPLNANYFILIVDESSYDGMSYPYKGIEKLAVLIKAHEEYFK